MLARMYGFAAAALLCTVVGCNDAAPAAVPPAVDTPAAKAPAEPKESLCDVTVDAPAEMRVGEEATVEISMRASGGYKINQEAPLEVRLESKTFETAREKYGVDEASVLASEMVTMEIPFTPATPGEHSFDVHAHYGLCGDLDCAQCRDKRRVTTRVN